MSKKLTPCEKLRVTFAWLKHFLIKHTDNDMALAAQIAALAVAQIDFQDDDLETAVEQTLTGFGELYRLSLELDQVSTNDQSVPQVAEGVLKLASAFGEVFKNLTPDQKEKASAAVRDIVTGANETLIENFFDACLTFIGGAQGLNEAIDGLTTE